MYLSYTPRFLQQLLPNMVWRTDAANKELFLTFDDGPIPEITEWILETLKAYKAKATFFCVGQNIERHQTIFEQIKAEGHAVGSHTYNHLSGWATENVDYILNVRKAAKLAGTNLFRPPYGRLKPSQTRFLKHHYRIIMWDVLSGDFDPSISAEQCFQNVIRNTINGSIIVFHDSIKSQEKVMYTLPKVLEHYTNLGYSFNSLDQFNRIPATQLA